MADTKATLPDDKTILKTADEVAAESASEEHTPAKEFIPYVVTVDGPRSGTRFQLKEGDNLIGRSVTGVVMLEDQSVSRKHAVLVHSRQGWILKDEGSKNGSYVNGNRVKEQINIGHGDIIQVGIYAMRLITKPITSDEEMAPLPPDIEGKTVMFAAPPADGERADTSTMHEKAVSESEAQTSEHTGIEGEDGLLEEGSEGLDDEEGFSEPEEMPEKKRSPLLTYGLMGLALMVVAIAGGIAYWKLMSPPPTPPVKPLVAGTEGQAVTPTGATQTGPKSVPVFLDFASSPLPAKVSMEGKDYGLAPVKVNAELEVGKTFTAQAAFTLDELQDTRIVTTTFTVEPNATIIPILFKGPIGILKITNIPRDVQLYLEGYYAEEPFKPHTAKISNVTFGKPIYVPYGKYNIELRQPKQLGESNQFIDDIRFKREVQITEENPVFELTVADEDLQKFPVEVRSIPDKADVFMDGQLVGQTPYKGIFPLGEHTMALRKDGYFEHSQTLKMDINTLYAIEVPLKTTVAGQFVNAGKALFNKGLYKEAIAQFAESFKNQPTLGETAEAQYMLGMCYMRLNNSATALAYFEQARVNPDFQYPAMLGLASIYGSSGDMTKALSLLVEVMLKAPTEEIKGEANSVFKQLSPLRSVMYIYTDPAGADVIVNDKPMQIKTPMILHDLGLGSYKLRIAKDGYVPQDLNISMSLAEFNPVIIKLKPVEE